MSSETQNDIADNSSKAKGNRVKRVRYLANLTREAFCEGSSVNLSTLISWEVGRFGGLSSKGAKKIVERVAKEGVICTPEWLINQVGPGPTLHADIESVIGNLTNLPLKVSALLPPTIQKELVLFKSLYSNSIDLIVDDDSMLPVYNVGDLVAGAKRYRGDIDSLIGETCIVQLKNGETLLRNLQCGDKKNFFHLLAYNFKSNKPNLFLYNVELQSAAVVVWHRRCSLM